MGYNMKGFSGFGEGTGSAAKFKSSPAKHDVEPHVEHHKMTGKVNTKGTKVINEKGDWAFITNRPDLVEEGTTRIGPGGKTQNITPEETEETKETEETEE